MLARLAVGKVEAPPEIDGRPGESLLMMLRQGQLPLTNLIGRSVDFPCNHDLV